MDSRAEANVARWLASSVVSEEDKERIRLMDDAQKDAAFFRDIEFGTGGMRGILGPGTNCMNVFTVGRVAIGYGQFLLSKYDDAKERGVVISHDNRHMSREFTLLCAKILNTQGIKAYIFDSLRPTPELSFAVRYCRAVGGIMITASHNPKEYNGFKVYDPKGCQLVPSAIQPMLDVIATLPDELQCQIAPIAEVPGETMTLSSDVDDKYVAAVEKIQINPDLGKQGFRIVYTPNHGTSYENAMRVFKDLGYDVTPVMSQCTHDPDFSGTLSPNPEDEKAYIEPLKLANQIDAKLVVMTDPDGDRCGLAYKAADGCYKRLTGNESAALLLDYILSEKKRKGLLREDGVLYDTIVSTDLCRKIARYYGIRYETFLTGFKFIGDRIGFYEDLGHGPHFEFGYEESYGCLIDPFVRDKDGIQAILLYCEMAVWYNHKGMTLDVAYKALQERFGYHYARTTSVFFPGSEGAADMGALLDKLRANPPKSILSIPVIRVEDYLLQVAANSDGSTIPLTLPKSNVIKLVLEDGSWIAVRPSGTEPKCKFYVEAVSKTEEGIVEKCASLSRNLLDILGVAK